MMRIFSHGNKVTNRDSSVNRCDGGLNRDGSVNRCDGSVNRCDGSVNRDGGALNRYDGGFVLAISLLVLFMVTGLLIGIGSYLISSRQLALAERTELESHLSEGERDESY